MSKMDLALNNLQWLIWHKTQLNQILPKLEVSESELQLCYYNHFQTNILEQVSTTFNPLL